MTARPVTVRSDDLELLLSGELPDAGRVTEAWHRMYAALHEEGSGAAPVSARDALLARAESLIEKAIRADEREQIAKLAERRSAVYREKPGGPLVPFADRIRRQP